MRGAVISATSEPGSRRLRRELRSTARDLARRRIAETLIPLLQERPPSWLDGEQAATYGAELLRLYQRATPPPRTRTHARGPA